MFEKGVKSFRSVFVLLAALNAEECIGPTIDGLINYLGTPRIFVVDGRSMDGKAEIVKNKGLEFFYQDGVGKGDAIAKGV